MISDNNNIANTIETPFAYKSNAKSYKTQSNRDIDLLKKGIWLYFFLWVFEGALRKWVLPGLSSPLLIIRDPLAIWLLIMAGKQNLFVLNHYIIGMGIIGFVGILTAIFFGHKSLSVALFGARILLIHFPLIFVIGRVFTYEDVIKMGKMIVYISIPMAMLVAMQFYSPQSAWVNRGVGGDIEGGGFSGAMGFFRPPATFSFITGTVAYYTLAASFIIFFYLNRSNTKQIILYAATFALIVVIPLSISRSLFFGVAIVLIFMAMAIGRKTEYLGKMVFGAVIISLLVIFLSGKSFFQTGTEAFTSRFETANEQEGGVEGVLIDRFLGGMFAALSNSSVLPFFGYGLGMGTNAGSKLLTGSSGFLIAEGEWGRVIGELGPLMGIVMIFLRLQLGFIVAIASYKNLARGNLLPWLLLSMVLINVPQGQWAQPSSLGFSVLVCGLAIAALKGPKEKKLKNRSQ